MILSKCLDSKRLSSHVLEIWIMLCKRCVLRKCNHTIDKGVSGVVFVVIADA